MRPKREDFLRRPCDCCGEYFKKTGKRQKICFECIKENILKGVIKRRNGLKK